MIGGSIYARRRLIRELGALSRLTSIGVAGLVLAACSSGPGAPAAQPGASAQAPSSAAQTTDEAAATAKNEPLEARHLLDSYVAVLIDRGAESDPQALEAMARPLCDGLTPCNVGVWDDRAQMPTKMPISGDETDAQVFSFGRTASDKDWALWNCDIFPQYEKDGRCLPRRR